MPSKATTVAEYLNELPEATRATIEVVRAALLDAVDDQIEEGMSYGMIGYYVPHRVYPAGYHCNPKAPLPFMNLGVQKNHISLHLMFLYMDEPRQERLREGFAKAGKKLDMGKACLRFRTVNDVDLGAIQDAIRSVPTAAYIAVNEAARTRKPTSRAKITEATAAKKAAAPKKSDRVTPSARTRLRE